MGITGVFLHLLLMLTAVSAAPSNQLSKRQEQPHYKFPQHFKLSDASQQGSTDPTTSQNSQNTPQFLSAGSNSNRNLKVPQHDQDHEQVSQSTKEIPNDEGILNVSVSTKQTDTRSTVVGPSPDQKIVKDSANLYLQKLIEDQRVANEKHRERQLQQLEEAKLQLEKQIENHKQLQIRWLEDKIVENKTLSEEEYTNSNAENGLGEDSKKIQKNKKLFELESDNDEDENKGENFEDYTTEIDLQLESISEEETRLFDKSNNEEDRNEGEHFEDYKAEIGLQLEKIIEGETPLFDKEDLGDPDKASSKIDIPQEVSDAVELVSTYFQLKSLNNLSVPEYVWSAVQKLSNYLN